MRRTGLLSVTFRKLPPEHIIELAREAGLDGIEWGGDVHVLPGNLTEAERVGRMTVAAGLQNMAYGSYWYADGEPQEIADTAAALGAEWIRIWAGKLGSAEASAEERRKVVDHIKVLCRCAGKIQVGAEWHGWTLTDTAESAARLLEEVGEDNFFCYFQREPGRDNLRDVALLPQGKIRAIHIQMWDGEAYHPLKEGVEIWRGLFSRLPRTAPALMEFVLGGTEEQFKEDAAVLRRLVAEEEKQG